MLQDTQYFRNKCFLRPKVVATSWREALKFTLTTQGHHTLLLFGIIIACVLHLSLVKFQQEWSRGVANPEKNASDPVSKTATAAAASKMWFAKLPTGVSLSYPKQCIAMETVPCDHPVIFHEFCLWPAVGMSAKWGDFSLLVMLCLVFVGKCIGKLINFKWLNTNILPTLVIWYITDASNLIGKAKFVIAVVGPVTLLSNDAALESRLTSRQVQGTLLESQIYRDCKCGWPSRTASEIGHSPHLVAVTWKYKKLI